VNIGLPNTQVLALTVSGTNLFAGTWGGGVFLSTNNGISWTTVNSDLTNLYVESFAAIGTNLFAGTWRGVFLSTNNGTNWTVINNDLMDLYVESLAVSGTNLFAGTFNGVWRRSLSDMITNVEDQNTGIPSQFILEQNYPNPFNPSTTIIYSLPTSEFVTLKVYDVLGKEVATLVNEEKPAGSYEVNFNATDLSSGIYFYTLKTGKFSETKKLVLMK
jgi:ligand-binding sensor domain-containing protein